METPTENNKTNKLIYRIAGFVLIVACTAGVIIGLAGIAATWQYQKVITTRSLSGIETASTALKATESGLVNMEQALTSTINSLGTLEKTLETTASTVESSAPAIESLVKITRDDLPKTVEAAQTSLTSAQESARVIDQVMSALTILPFVDYAPEVPLHEALEAMTGSLDDLPVSFFLMQTGLASTERNLEVVQGDVTEIAGNVSDIKTSLEDTQSTLIEYQTLTANLANQVENLQTKLPGWLLTAAWAVTGLLVWAVLLQAAMAVVGLYLTKAA